MADGNYTLNFDNVIDFIKLTDAGYEEGASLHYKLGITDDRAQEISNHAYNLVWDEIETNEFSGSRVIGVLFRDAKAREYNDLELVFYLYWAFSEMDSFLNPNPEISLIVSEEDTINPQEN